MRPHNAPAWDRGHRDTYPPAVRAAMALLDRAAVGEPVAEVQIVHALVLTGDIEVTRLTRHEHHHAGA